MAPFLETRGLRIDYDEFTAVHTLDLSIDPGSIFGLIGPNGAGKTSTIRALSTLLEPTLGEVRICGIDAIESPREAHALLGYMPDTCPLYEDIRVREFLHVFASSYFLPRDTRPKTIDDVLQLTDLTGKADAFVGTLSRGMRQRLVLAKTLLHDPKVLLLDEPASGLDPMARIELREILRQLGRMNKAVLISSHILTELSDFCTHIGIMERGRMVVTGGTAEIEAQLQPGLLFRIELREPDERAAGFLQKQAGVRSCRSVDPRIFEITLDASDPDAPERLLRELVQQGLRVRTFSEKRLNLEDIFLKIGAKEVS